MLVILGPTASGKTILAAHLARRLEGEVISADSRQVYRGMDIGTGKDYADYQVGGVSVPYHLIDIVDPGYEYNIYEYQRDFLEAFNNITRRGRFPILCGGSGMYLEAILKKYQLPSMPEDDDYLRALESKTTEELTSILATYKRLHNKTDLETRARITRAILIEHQAQLERSLVIGGRNSSLPFPEIRANVFGITFPRGLLKNRITDRLTTRISNGLIDEVKNLLIRGISPERLIRYGLEYKFTTQYLSGTISLEELFYSLNKAIHQFSKRQMTWFRRMERQGIKITWIDGRLPVERKIDQILREMNAPLKGRDHVR